MEHFEDVHATTKLETLLKVVRIPCDDTPCTIETFSLARLGPDDFSLEVWRDAEKCLTCFPRIWKSHNSSQNFSWKYRSLIGVTAASLGENSGEWKADYLMYTCQDKEANLPHNTYLEKLSGTTVYGDAYVFKMQREQTGENGSCIATYYDLGDDFALAAKDKGFPNQILWELLIALPKRKK